MQKEKEMVIQILVVNLIYFMTKTIHGNPKSYSCISLEIIIRILDIL